MIQGLTTQNAPRAIGPYSQAMICDDLLFCSGQTPIDPQTMELVGNDIVPQTRRALTNLQIVLKSANIDLSSVVKTTVYLKSMADFDRMNKVYEQMFGDHRPARTTVEVSRLPLDALVEIDCIARMITRTTT